MTKRHLVALMAAVTLAAPGCAGHYEQASVGASISSYRGTTMSVSYFYDELSPYGRWVDAGSYGWCWVPYDVNADWRPYYDGRWVYTDLGWAWASDEPWGWACYHYGRWFSHPDYGWTWMPDTEWGPAWVAWRSGDDWVGWAPLPPQTRWQASVGLNFNSNSIPMEQWCFVRQRDLISANVRPNLAPVSRNLTLMRRTRDVTRFESRNGRPADVGVDPQLIERASGRQVTQLKPVDSTRPGRADDQSGAGAIGFFRPRLTRAPRGEAPRPETRVQSQDRPDATEQQQWNEEKRVLEASLAEQRNVLERDQQREASAPAPNVTPDEQHRRFVAERQAFDTHAARSRRFLDSKLKHHLVKPGRNQPDRKGGSD